MRFTFDVYEDSDNPRRIDTFTRPEEAEKYIKYLGKTHYIVITDNLNKLPTYSITTEVSWDDWIHSREVAAVWKDKEHKWNPFDEKETDIHMMKDGVYYPTTSSRELREELIDSNLKTAAARKKPVVSSVPPIAILALGAAMQDGVSKYGRFNWRKTETTATVFYDAMMRHLIAWYSGEDYAPDSKVHHLAHVMAGCAIILDSVQNGVFNDNRLASEVVTQDNAEHHYWKK